MQKVLTDIISAVNFFKQTLCACQNSSLGDVRRVRDAKVALPPLNVLRKKDGLFAPSYDSL